VRPVDNGNILAKYLHNPYEPPGNEPRRLTKITSTMSTVSSGCLVGDTAMMFILRDDPVIEIFDSPDKPPDWIEAIDIENNEYQFCDDDGQQYVGVITRPSSWFRLPLYELKPVGSPDLANALTLFDRAVAIKPDQMFDDLAALRSYLLDRQRGI
jgi:hypothetical protein